MSGHDELVRERDTLRATLRKALVQLDGWICWKCPKHHLQEHQEHLAEMQAVLLAEMRLYDAKGQAMEWTGERS